MLQTADAFLNINRFRYTGRPQSCSSTLHLVYGFNVSSSRIPYDPQCFEIWRTRLKNRKHMADDE